MVKRILFLLTLLSGIHQLEAQANDTLQFSNKIDKLLLSRPTDYKSINTEMSAYRSDTIKMKQLRKLAKTNDYKLGEAYALNAIGTVYRDISHYHDAIELHKKAQELAVEAESVEFEVSSLNAIGVAYRRMVDVKAALDYHAKALELAATHEPQTEILKYNIAVSQNSMGNIYLELKQYELAITQFQKSLKLEKEMSNRLGLAINFQNIGYAYEMMEDYDKALSNYRRSLSYNEQIDSEVGKVICYNSIGQVFIKQSKLEDAKLMVTKALGKALQIGDRFYTTLSYNNLGWVHLKLGNLAQAEKNLLAALEMSKDYNLTAYEVSASELLSELYQEKGMHEQALTLYRRSKELENTYNTERNVKYVNDVIVQFENEAKNRQIETLVSANEAVNQRLEKNQRIFWSALLGLIILAGVLFTISSNRRLSQEKKILTLEQDMLRNQMNPHFIFNSLNSIKLYIINNEKENAVYYLNKFSKLIRKILVASSEKIITLRDELETMQLYMNIENIRFSNEINFEISVDEDINTSSVRIPPLILQPFLENALWHGLSTKKDNKTIKLEVQKESPNFIHIIITDNGIGRKRSEELKRSQTLQRDSLGISITKARLSNFSMAYTHLYELEIEDLMDTNDDALGTKVILKLPIRTSVLKSA